MSIVFWLHSKIATYLLLGYNNTLEQHPVFCYIDTVASTVFDVILLSQSKPGERVYICYPLESSS